MAKKQCDWNSSIAFAQCQRIPTMNVKKSCLNECFFHMKWESHSLSVVVDTQLVDMLFERFDDTLVERPLDD